MKIVTFYTNDKYRDYAKRLRESASRFGLDTVISARPHMKTWAANVNWKPDVILEALRAFKEDILYVDADAAVVQEPKLLKTINHIMAAQFMDHAQPRGGTLFFKNDPLAVKLVEAWIGRVKDRPEHADDFVNLPAALTEVRMKPFHLPPSYCWHEKTMRAGFPTAEPVIVHWCAGEHTYKMGWEA
jgi:hypothetical protein